MHQAKRSEAAAQILNKVADGSDLGECHSRRHQIMKTYKAILFRVRAYSFHKLPAKCANVHPEL